MNKYVIFVHGIVRGPVRQEIHTGKGYVKRRNTRFYPRVVFLWQISRVFAPVRVLEESIEWPERSFFVPEKQLKNIPAELRSAPKINVQSLKIGSPANFRVGPDSTNMSFAEGGTYDAGRQSFPFSTIVGDNSDTQLCCEVRRENPGVLACKWHFRVRDTSK